MILSMTGFGKAEVQLENKSICIELRSLNSKTADINARIPSFLKELEADFRKQLSNRLNRGKIDLYIQLEFINGATPMKINTPVVMDYIEQLKSLDKDTATDVLSIAMRLPEALSSQKEELKATEIESIKTLLTQVIDLLEGYRTDEGAVMAKDFMLRLKNLQALLEKVIEIDPKRAEKIRLKLSTALEELEAAPDVNRFEQELIFYLEKYDITEEKVRLKNHINYFKEVMDESKPNGKKLGFIAQEMGREINTIGSKANHSELQKIVVQMKDELEKIKEQLLNVL